MTKDSFIDSTRFISFVNSCEEAVSRELNILGRGDLLQKRSIGEEELVIANSFMFELFALTNGDISLIDTENVQEAINKLDSR